MIPVVRLLVCGGVGYSEEAVVEPHLDRKGVVGGDPVDDAFHLAALGLSVERGGVVAATELHYLAVPVLDGLLAAHHISPPQAHLGARRQPEKTLGRIFHEVLPLDVELPRKGDSARAGSLRIVRKVGSLQLLDLVFRPVLDHHPQGIVNAHHAGRGGFELLADAAFELPDIHKAVGPSDADARAEIADRLRRYPAAAEPRQGRHARIVPAGHHVFPNQLLQETLAHHRVAQIKPGEFDLLRPGLGLQLFEKPLVERAMILEFHRANGMGDPLDVIGLSVGPVVGWIDGPGIARTVVGFAPDAVEHRVAHVQVRGGHFNLRPERAGAVRELSGPHPFEEIQIFLHGAVPVRAFASGRGQGAAAFADFLGGLVADEGLAFADQLHRKLVELLEVIRRVIAVRAPVEPEPAHILLDRGDVGEVFRERVGVVETQVALAAVVQGQPEVEADGFGVTNVEETVGLRRKPRGHPTAVFPGG